MNDDPLLSCRIKIDRATKHFNDLTQAIKPFANRETYRIWADEQSEPAIKIYRVKITEDMPPEWSGYIGDVIHNLRSALDCLATELVLKYCSNVNDEILRKTYFPISWDEPGLTNNKRRAEFFERVGPEVEKVIRLMEPYRGGNGHALWQLDQLDVADKHRRILPARGAVVNVEFFVPSPETGGAVSAPQQKPPFPLKDGDEVCRVVFFQPEFNANAHFTLEIAFNEPPIAVGEPVMPTLTKFHNFVERVITIFEQRFF